tara:strand:- start:99 stop:362 length:264 start_codon:yes stop_codon:yes gene_type:complete
MKLTEYIKQLELYNTKMFLENGVEPDVKFEYHSMPDFNDKKCVTIDCDYQSAVIITDACPEEFTNNNNNNYVKVSIYANEVKNFALD